MEGYRRLTYMMLDRDVVAVSASSVYRVLRGGGLLRPWPRNRSSKGAGFKQPLRPHEHRHLDASYLNIRGTFFYLLSVLDGFSRAIVHHEIRTVGAFEEKTVRVLAVAREALLYAIQSVYEREYFTQREKDTVSAPIDLGLFDDDWKRRH